MKIKALKAFTIRDSSTGALTSIAHGSVADLDSTLANELITEGLAEAYTLVSPTGKKTINSTAETDVVSYATAQVVDANLVAENIKDDVTILGVEGTYAGGTSDFTTAEVTLVNSPEMESIYCTSQIDYPAEATDKYFASGVPVSNNKITALLYDGTGILSLFEGYADVDGDTQLYTPTFTASTGGVTYDNDTGEVTVTGDGTLSITWTKHGGAS